MKKIATFFLMISLTCSIIAKPENTKASGKQKNFLKQALIALGTGACAGSLGALTYYMINENPQIVESSREEIIKLFRIIKEHATTRNITIAAIALAVLSGIGIGVGIWDALSDEFQKSEAASLNKNLLTENPINENTLSQDCLTEITRTHSIIPGQTTENKSNSPAKDITKSPTAKAKTRLKQVPVQKQHKRVKNLPTGHAHCAQCARKYRKYA